MDCAVFIGVPGTLRRLCPSFIRARQNTHQQLLDLSLPYLFHLEKDPASLAPPHGHEVSLCSIVSVRLLPKQKKGDAYIITALF